LTQKSQYSISNQKDQQAIALQNVQSLSKNVHIFHWFPSLALRSALELRCCPCASYWCCGLNSSRLFRQI